MRVVADGAAFAEGFVLEYERPGLFAVALRAAFVAPGHGQAARGFENVASVRIMALNTVHPAFDHRMMLRQAELGMGFYMALEAWTGILARIHDELAAPAAGRDMLAARSMTGFAPGLA